ncbi:MAG: hypothetical protein GY872_03745 [Roseibacillus sp.]|nr:hypothetical protein [Roseibacillus sp.]
MKEETDNQGGGRINILSAGILLSVGLAAAVLIALPGHHRAPPVPDTPPKAVVSGGLYERFCVDIVPVLERRCSSCHGVLQEESGILADSTQSKDFLRWPVNAGGRIKTRSRLRQTYDIVTARPESAATSSGFIDFVSDPGVSPFLRAPLASGFSASTHPEVFSSPEDPDYRVLFHWIEEEIESGQEAKLTLSSGAELYFAEKVTPILVRKTCFGCHGPLAFNDLKLDPGIPGQDTRFSPRTHKHNRREMLGTVTRMVHLSGDVRQSKQLLKNFPVEEGGIVHKGGNNFFRKDDPDYQVLLHWLKLEAQEAREHSGAALGELEGIVFVRRPKNSPERFFEDISFLPGGDLFLLKDGREVNLTASLHPAGPADVRAPEVSYDARHVVFAMRRSEGEPFNVWEIELASGKARQMTFSEVRATHFMDPIYVPDPDDVGGDDLERVCLVMVSNVDGEWCESSPSHVLGEAEGGTKRSIIDHELTEAPGRFNGRTLQIVTGTNAGETRMITQHEFGELVVDRPFPLPCDTSTHYTIMVEPRFTPKFEAYRMRRAARGEEKRIFDESLKRMTYSASQVRRPAMRSSGEIMFTCLRSGWQSGRPFYNGAVFRTHVDGSNFHTHNGNRSAVPIHADNREMPNGLEIRIGRDADSHWGGMLMLADHQFGPTIENNNPLDDLDHPYGEGTPTTAMFKFVPGWIGLDEHVTCRGQSPGGVYRDPYPMPDGGILVAHARGPLDLHDPAAAPDFNIVILRPDPAFQSSDGFKAGKSNREVVVAGHHTELWPRPVVARLKEPVKKKMKLETDLFGPPARVRGFTGYRQETPAVVQVYDMVLLDAFFEQSTPTGVRHLGSPVCPSCMDPTPDLEQVRYARIIATEPQDEGDRGEPRRVMIGEVPLETDGSFAMQVPSGISFDIQSLNGMQMALRSPNRWLYCHPGEKHGLSIPRPLYAQTCSGCHGGLTGKSEDTLRRPDAISSASRTQAIWDLPNHHKRNPANYGKSNEAMLTAVSYQRDILPIVRAKCVACHAGPVPAAKLDLAGETGYDALTTHVNLHDKLAIRSYLIEKLHGRELHATRALSGDHPHPSQQRLTREELLAFVRWVDLGARKE